VEEVIGLVVDALAKSAKARAAAGKGQPPRNVPPGPPRPPAPVPGGAPIHVRLPAAPAAARPAAAQAQPPAPAPRPAPVRVEPPLVPPAPPPGLLSAFTSRERLLAAIVLSEALAPPVALRDNSLPSRSVEEAEMRRIDAG
jgi:hypothetical protein